MPATAYQMTTNNPHSGAIATQDNLPDIRDQLQVFASETIQRDLVQL